MPRTRTRSARERAMLLTALGLAAWWVVVLAPNAEAYIDPSAGGMLIQLLLAGTAGVAVLGKLLWTKVRRMMGMADPDATVSAPADADDPNGRV